MGWPIYAIYGGILGLQYAYHRLTAPPPLPPPRPQDLIIPRTEEGTAIPLVYGRVRVRTPVLAWMSDPATREPTTGVFVYMADMFFVVGVPFAGGTQGIHGMWIGSTKLNDTPGGGYGTHSLEDLNGNGNEGVTKLVHVRPSNDPDPANVGAWGYVEFLNGRSDQTMFPPTLPGSPTLDTDYPVAGAMMHRDGLTPALIPGYRGVLSVLLFEAAFGDTPAKKWQIGETPQPGSYSFEVSSYPAGFTVTATRIGDDVNPISVLSDLLIGTLGKLGLSAGLLDEPSFSKAADTLAAEAHGYSRVIEDVAEASDIIQEILTQIDGVLYDNPATGTLGIKLIRADFDPNTIPQINPSNCVRIENFTMRGLSDLPNKVRLIYTSRLEGYAEKAATAQNQSQAVGQDGRVHEVTLRMPGICTAELAETIVARELGILSLPLKTCRAIVDRSFWNVTPGSAVSVLWPDYHLPNVVFRVAGVDRGGHDSNTIALDLIEDHHYVYRKKVYTTPVAPFPTDAVVE